MDGSRNPSSASAVVGFRLLPSELIEDILTRLTLPELLRVKCLSKSVASVASTDFFRRGFNLRSRADAWLFVYPKRSLRDSVLYGFTRRARRWFRIPVFNHLEAVEDLYFLTASAGFFLFASNNCRQLIVLNLAVNAVRKIPPSPLGPRDTSSLRRSGFKLIPGLPGSGQFWFLFAELHHNRPVLFEYSSETDTWKSHEAEEDDTEDENLPREQRVFLSVVHRRTDSVILWTRLDRATAAPKILRPRFDGGAVEVGFSVRNEVGRLHLYGDGCMVVVRSEGAGARVRVFTSLEVWGVCVERRGWAFMSKVPEGTLDKVRRPYNAMTGCVEEREGHVRVVLVTNCERSWELIWLEYDVEGRTWSWVPLPQFMSKGMNMSGIALSSGLTL